MRRIYPWLVLLLIALLALAGCQPQGAAAPTPTAPPATATPVPATATPIPATATPIPALAPTSTPTASPTAEPVASPTSAPAVSPTAIPTTLPSGAGEQIFFLRAGDLLALNVPTGAEATVATGVSGFAATPDGRLLAMTRGEGAAGEIWLLRRDTGELRRLTTNDRAEATLSWAPDGLSIAYTSSPAAPASPLDWQTWSAWCVTAEVRVIDLPGGLSGPASEERTLGPGCEPAFGPDGRRIVYSAAPAKGGEPTLPGADNALLMVNRQGRNSWRVAIANPADPDQGQVVYSAAWSPDAGRVAYQRFLGYQALVDINLSEVSSSFQRNGAPIGIGAGWMLPPRFSPDGRLVAITDFNYSDARGFSGYDIWGTSILRFGETTTITLPSRDITLQAVEVDSLTRATGVAWSPDGSALVALLPAGWRAGGDRNEPLYPDAGPGELWRWRPGAAPEIRIATGVDFGSPLLWLPAAPGVTTSEARIAVALPTGWRLRAIAQDYLTADGPPGTTLAARLVAGGPAAGIEGLFPELITVTGLDDPWPLPDGSTVRGVQGTAPGGAPLAGAMRITSDEAVVAVYLTTPQRWPLERAVALGLLVASGR